MKTAISLADELFHAVERNVRRSRRHRSEVYADALRAYVARHSPEAVTEMLDQVVAEAGQGGDVDFAAAAARRVLENAEW